MWDWVYDLISGYRNLHYLRTSIFVLCRIYFLLNLIIDVPTHNVYCICPK